MQDPIRTLRNALAFQLELAGPLVPTGGSSDESVAPPAIASENETMKEAMAAPESSELSPEPSLMPNQNIFGEDVDPLNDASLSPYERINKLIPADSPLHEMDSLTAVAEYVANTVLIPIDETRISPVFGVGNPNANLLVIGEAPGADEDKKGEPFVGRAGQLLTKILEAVDFTRDSVYIANILKSRPPNNRDPLPAEVEAHFPILLKQITLIKPRIILCVGKTAGNNLLNKKSSLGALRGTFQDFHGIPTVVTYHPAALLRNSQWKRPTWEDVQMLRARYDELTAGTA